VFARGELLGSYQTQINRLRQDEASLEVETMDRTGKRLRARAKGSASSVRPRDSRELNDKKELNWMCHASEFVIQTLDFDLHLDLEIGRL
jgi:hypothetical protein